MVVCALAAGVKLRAVVALLMAPEMDGAPPLWALLEARWPLAALLDR